MQTPSRTAVSSYCFCTLAFGQVYRTLARATAADIQRFAPGVDFVIFTDRPADFATFDHIRVFPHQRRGVFCYHERRFAIARALEDYPACIYLDADVRLCAPVPESLSWQPGITARSGTAMRQHLQGQIYKNGVPRPEMVAKYRIVQQMAEQIGIDIDDPNVTWINEFLFTVARDGGREQAFLDLWGKLALWAELHGLHKHPAYAIGLAAAKVGLPIRMDEMAGLDFFDDRIERVRIAQGQSAPETKAAYFEFQKSVEHPAHTLMQRGLRKIGRRVSTAYHTARFRLTTRLPTF